MCEIISWSALDEASTAIAIGFAMDISMIGIKLIAMNRLSVVNLCTTM